MSADLLKRAATKLREAAADAPAPPWRVTLNYNRKHPTVIAGATWLRPGRKESISLKHPGNLGEARWNALTDPSIAEPLALVLESVAETWPRGAVHTTTASAAQGRKAAVSLARAILGEQQDGGQPHG